MMDSLEKLIETISKEAGKGRDEVARLIEEKKEELSGLVSEEGAAYIVGRELGVSLLKEGKRNLKVKNLVEGLRGVDFVGRVVNISDIREFEREGKKGRVLSLLLGDETGIVRLPLWNQEIDLFGQLEIREDDVLSLSGAWTKLDNRGNTELRLGKGKMEKSKEKIVLPPKQEIKKFTDAKRREINSLKEGDVAEVRGCLVQLFRKEPFFETCPEDGTRVFEEEGKFRCKEHGIVKPESQVVISGVVDDGTGNMRVVFFRELAEQLFGENVKGLKQIAKQGKDNLSIYDHFKGMGKDFLVRGRVKRNDFTENLEIVVNQIQEVDIREEADTLLKKLQGKG